MLELGDTAVREHREVGVQAASSGVDRLFLFGPNAPHTAEGAAGARAPAEAKVYATRQELADALLSVLQPGDVVLVKGSRGMKMNEVVDLVVAAKGVA